MSDLAALLACPEDLAQVAAMRGEKPAVLRKRLQAAAARIADGEAARAEVTSVELLTRTLATIRTAKANLPQMARRVLAEHRRIEEEEPANARGPARDLLVALAEGLSEPGTELMTDTAVTHLTALALAGEVPASPVVSTEPKPAKAAPPRPRGQMSPAVRRVLELLLERPRPLSELVTMLHDEGLATPRGVMANLGMLTRYDYARRVDDRYELTEAGRRRAGEAVAP